MISSLNSAAVTLLIGSLMVAPLRAQSPVGHWDNLQLIKLGQEIKIVTNDAKAYRGKLGSLNADTVMVHLVSGDQTFERMNIVRVAYKSRGRRSHHIKVGSGIGAGVGLLSGLFSDRCSTHRCWSAGKAISVSVLVSGLVGAAIGAALPAGGWEVIYQSP